MFCAHKFCGALEEDGREFRQQKWGKLKTDAQRGGEVYQDPLLLPPPPRGHSSAGRVPYPPAGLGWQKRLKGAFRGTDTPGVPLWLDTVCDTCPEPCAVCPSKKVRAQMLGGLSRSRSRGLAEPYLPDDGDKSVVGMHSRLT